MRILIDGPELTAEDVIAYLRAIESWRKSVAARRPVVVISTQGMSEADEVEIGNFVLRNGPRTELVSRGRGAKREAPQSARVSPREGSKDEKGLG